MGEGNVQSGDGDHGFGIWINKMDILDCKDAKRRLFIAAASKQALITREVFFWYFCEYF